MAVYGMPAAAARACTNLALRPVNLPEKVPFPVRGPLSPLVSRYLKVAVNVFAAAVRAVARPAAPLPPAAVTTAIVASTPAATPQRLCISGSRALEPHPYVALDIA